MSSIWAVVPAAGSGRRMAAEAPKQYLRIAGISLLEHTLRGLLACSAIRGVVVALDPGDRRADTVASLSDPRVSRSSGGTERADSVLAGLEALFDVAGEQDWVLVHDAARPCLPLRNLQHLIDTVKATGMGTVLAQPVNDTVKRVDNEGVIAETLDRSTLWRAQTPQMFRLRELRDALRRALEQGAAVTDEASAMEFAGYPVRVLEGPSCNLKVTVPEDLQLAEHYLKAAAAKRL